MLTDAIPGPVRGYDHVVVGGGAAGCVVAARLSADPSRSVLLLEAGPSDSDPAVATSHGAFALARGELDWSYDTAPEPGLGGRAVPISGGRTLGGGGSINYQAWFRGHPADYDGWASSGMTGWGWADVLPAFRRSEDHELGASALHGVGGPIPVTSARDINPLSAAFVEAGTACGLPLNRDLTGTDLDGVGLIYTNTRDGRRHSAARGYLHPATSRPNLTVRTDALVRRVLLRGTRTTGVEYAGPDGTPVVVRSGSVVLCAGGVRSAQVLMLSGVGPAQHLRERGVDPLVDSPGVGENLQDHPAGTVVWPVTRGLTWAESYTDENVRLYTTLGRGPLASIGQAGAFLRCASGAAAPDVQLLPMLTDVTGGTAPAMSCLVILLVPRSRGRVRLRSADAATNPVIEMGYLTDPDDRRVLLEGLRRTVELGESTALRARVGPARPARDAPDDVLVDALRTSMISMNHPAGTCRAGTDDTAVVGPDLRVHGVDGLHVVDSSVMPVLPRANTHAASIMIGERGAELVAAHVR